MKTLISIFIIFLMCVSMVSAQGEPEDAAMLEKQLETNPDNPELLLKLGRIYHNMGAGGDKAAVKKAVDYLEKLIELNPGHAGAHCWYGSALTLKGRDAWFPLFKISHVNKGLSEMDKAVSLDPENIHIRMARAGNGLALPDMFNRMETVLGDYEHLKNMAEKKPGSLDSQTYLSVLFNLGRAYARAGNHEKSVENLNMVIRMAPDSELSKSSKTMIAKFDEKEKQ
jgi:tetratricopeptide (TPR) repeat protein